MQKVILFVALLFLVFTAQSQPAKLADTAKKDTAKTVAPAAIFIIERSDTVAADITYVGEGGFVKYMEGRGIRKGLWSQEWIKEQDGGWRNYHDTLLDNKYVGLTIKKVLSVTTRPLPAPVVVRPAKADKAIARKEEKPAELAKTPIKN